MRSTTALVIVLLLSTPLAYCQNQTESTNSKTHVYASHNGSDKVGAAFFTALKRELSNSNKYEVGVNDASADDRTFRFYIDLNTIEIPSRISGSAGFSAASIVIEHMGLPNSYPVPSMWYHKAFLLEPNRLDEVAKEFVSDMDARWCRTIKNSVGGCPKESLPPTIQ